MKHSSLHPLIHCLWNQQQEANDEVSLLNLQQLGKIETAVAFIWCNSYIFRKVAGYLFRCHFYAVGKKIEMSAALFPPAFWVENSSWAKLSALHPDTCVVVAPLCPSLTVPPLQISPDPDYKESAVVPRTEEADIDVRQPSVKYFLFFK